MCTDCNPPVVKQTAIIYHVSHPNPATRRWADGYFVYIEVEDSDYAQIQQHSSYYGKSYKNMEHSERMDLYTFLVEHELLEWRKIGPEDSELFATEKLRKPAKL